MRWRTGRRSANVEDRRGQAGGRGGISLGGRTRAGRAARGGGVGGIGIVIIAIIAMFLGVDPSVLLQMAGGGGQIAIQQPVQTQATAPGSRADDELAEFVSVVLADTEDTWNPIFKSMGQEYREPTLVLYDGLTSTACGSGDSAMGPFYCPADEKVYIDLSFFRDLKSRFGAPGDFAQAYVLAHEIGHHVQTQLGISQQVAQAKRGRSRSEQNQPLRHAGIAG